MLKKKWTQILLAAVALVALAALVLGILLLAGVFEPDKVGLCLPSQDHRWSEYYDLLEEKLLASEYQVERCTVNADQFAQTQQVRSLLDRGFRHFVIQPVDARETEDLLQMLRQSNAKAVFINVQPEKLAEYTGFSYVGFDPVQAGKLQAQSVLDMANRADHNGDGEISYAVLDLEEESARQASCDEAMQQVNAACLEVQLCTYDSQSAKQRCALLLSRHGKDLEVIFCADDLLAMGALEAIEDGGRTAGEDIFLVGANATAQSLELVKQGALAGTLMGDFQAAEQVLQLLESDEQVIYHAPYVPVDPKNTDIT